jgi:two-component system, LuxR family, response regulator FixJ
MDSSNKLYLIDSNVRRRAAITHELSGSGIHVEPFEDVKEIRQSWPRTGIILAENLGDTVSRLIDHMSVSDGWLPIVAFADRPSTQQIVQAMMSGAVDFLDWPASAAEIQGMLASVARNTAKVGNLRLREARARSRVQKLTRREREVLAGVAGGLSNRLIGEKLEISPRTVEIHRANMLTKMGANHTSEAIRIAIEAELEA